MMNKNLAYFRNKGKGLVQEFLLVAAGVVLTLAVIGIIKVIWY